MRFVNPMTKKLLKSLLKGTEKVVEMCTGHTILSQQSWHHKQKKKKTETCESPDVDAKRRNNPIQTHTKTSLGLVCNATMCKFFT